MPPQTTFTSFLSHFVLPDTASLSSPATSPTSGPPTPYIIKHLQYVVVLLVVLLHLLSHPPNVLFYLFAGQLVRFQLVREGLLSVLCDGQFFHFFVLVVGQLLPPKSDLPPLYSFAFEQIQNRLVFPLHDFLLHPQRLLCLYLQLHVAVVEDFVLAAVAYFFPLVFLPPALAEMVSTCDEVAEGAA